MARRVPIARARSGMEIDDLAHSYVRKFQPKALMEPTPFNIELFFECDLEKICGVKPDYQYLPPGIHGYTDSDEMVSVISSDLMEQPRQLRFCRSTMAHEAGHALMHVREFRDKKRLLISVHDKKHVSLKLYRESDVPVYKNPEWQAWRFAGALLMPARTIAAPFKEGLNDKELANLFDVNPAFVRARLRALRLAT